jgi:hypothetical protein
MSKKFSIHTIYGSPTPTAVTQLLLNTGTIDKEGFIKVQGDLWVHPRRRYGTFKSKSDPEHQRKGSRLATLPELQAIYDNLPFILEVIENLQLTESFYFDHHLNWVDDLKPASAIPRSEWHLHNDNDRMALCFNMHAGEVSIEDTIYHQSNMWVYVKGSL